MNHYKQSNMEAIEIMRGAMSDEQFEGFLLGNVYKYLHRYRHKFSADADLAKALDYLNALCRFVANNDISNPFHEPSK